MGKWIQESAPANNQDFNTGGWLKEVSVVWRQGRKYVVLCRNIETQWGEVIHAAIRNADNTDIPWKEKQRIKNEIFGREAVALEVFPAESKLIDEANMYHIWIMPKEFIIPFGIHRDDANN